MSFYDELTEVSVTCIDAPKERVRDSFEHVLVSKGASVWRFTDAKFNPKTIYFPAPRPGGAFWLAFALWEPANAEGRCAFMANSSDGLFNLIANVHRVHGLDCFFLRYSRAETESGICEFIRLLRDGSRRIVRCLQEDTWEFYQDGPVLPFEDVAHYRKRRIKDRLSEDILVSYAMRSGWDIRAADFWRSKRSATIARETASLK